MKFKYEYSGTGFLHDAWEYGEFKDLDAATEYAYQQALEDFHGYGGLHGLGMEMDEYFDEYPDHTEEDYYNMMEEEAENTINYIVVSCSDKEWKENVG